MKRLLQSLLIFAATSIFIISCTTSGVKKTVEPREKPKGTDQISVMNFNVENLFDNIHDDNRDDFAYARIVLRPNLAQTTPF